MGGSGSRGQALPLHDRALFCERARISLSSFARIAIVLSFLRQALGTQQLPPNQVLLGLALALSAFVMAPTARNATSNALGPFLNDQMAAPEALERASAPIREFMLRQTRTDDLRLFIDASGQEAPQRGDTLSMSVVVPAFMVSELTTAFRMGLMIYLPLLLIDLLVASLTMSLGMMMVPPTDDLAADQDRRLPAGRWLAPPGGRPVEELLVSLGARR